MIEQRTLDLIHAELDGELHVGDLAELQRRLEADPEAQAAREQLGRIAASLERMAPEAPPAGLQEQILQATRPAAKVLPFRDRRIQFVRYTMALAAGIAIAAVGIQFAGSSGPGLDADQLVGTIGGQAGSTEPSVEQVMLQAPGLNGSVSLSADDGRWKLVFDTASEQPVKVTAAYADTAFRLKAYAPDGPGAGAVSSSPGLIEFVNQGSQQRVLFLEPAAGGAVRISFEGQGKLLQEAVLDVPGQVAKK